MKTKMLLVLLLTVSLLLVTACGATTPTAQTTQAAATTAAAATAETTTAAAAQEATTTAAAAQAAATTAASAQATTAAAAEPPMEFITLKVGLSRSAAFGWEGTETQDDNAWTNWYRENGLLFDILFEVNEETYNDKLAQSIMSGVYPDIIRPRGANYIDWANQGIFADLTDLYNAEPEDSEVKQYYNTPLGQDTLQAATLDGVLYSLPRQPDPYGGMSQLWLRYDWLIKLGLPEPKTHDDVYNIAKAFTENDPDGNGVNDTYGLGVNGSEVFHNIAGLNRLFEMFGVIPGGATGTIPFIDSEGHAIFGGGLEQNMKDGLNWLVKMYNDGYIPQDFITAGVDQVRQDASVGRIGMYFGSFSGVNNVWFNCLATQPEAEWAAFAIPGYTAETNGTTNYTVTPAYFTCLSSKCEYPEAFMKCTNLSMKYLAHPDTLSQEDFEKYNGKGGTYTGWQLAMINFEVPSKNYAAFPRQQKAIYENDTSLLNAENWRDYNSIQEYLERKDREYSTLSEDELAMVRQGVFFYSVWGSKYAGYAAIDEMVKNEPSRLIRSAYNSVQTENMVQYSPTLDTLAKETLINIILGNQSVDSYSDFLQQWETLGGSIIREEADAWYQSVK